MILRYGRHAAERMAQRGVTEGDISHALSHVFSSWPTEQNSLEYQGAGLNGRTLKVWVMPRRADAPYVVKSVAWKGEDDE